MSAPFTLYTHEGPGPNPYKVAMLLSLLGLEYNVVPLVFGDDAERGVKSAKFLKINPNGRVPALVDHSNNDFVVWESGAILFYLAEKYDKSGSFFGKTVEEKTQVAQWLTHQLSGLGPVQGNLNYYHHYWASTYGEEPQKSIFTRFEGESHRLYKLLDEQLAKQKAAGSSYIVLDRPTIADLTFYPWVNIAGFGKLDISAYKNVNAWLENLKKNPKVEAAYKKVQG